MLNSKGRALLVGGRWGGRATLLIPLMLCPAAVPHAQPAERPPDTMEARLRACVPCHGRQGEGTSNDYFPRLAGKPAGYLMNQLVAFRDGRRRQTIHVGGSDSAGGYEFGSGGGRNAAK